MTGYILTYTGRMIEPLNPDIEQIDILDIAHALSNSCRFTGHVRKFYSVAEHSVRASELVSPTNRLCALLHDASEAYLSDIARPVKQQPIFGEVYKAAENRLMEVIAERFGFMWPMPNEVHEADNVLLVTEARDLMHGTDQWSPEYQAIPKLSTRIHPWLPVKAEARFLSSFHYLIGDIAA